MDGEAVLSCLVLAIQMLGKEILTIEGLARDGEPDPVLEGFVKCGAIQCGYCTPGMIMSAGKLTFWGSKQIPYFTYRNMAKALV
jgi:aerobic-type carbon monoxide dehydrogenase small subunit (CoxS/CutS family)